MIFIVEKRNLQNWNQAVIHNSWFLESVTLPFKAPPPGGSQEISQIHNLVISCFYFRGFYHFWSLEYTCECFFINCNAPNGDKSPFPIEIMDKNWGFSSRIRTISWMFYCRQRFRHDKEETRRYKCDNRIRLEKLYRRGAPTFFLTISCWRDLILKKKIFSSPGIHLAEEL